MPLARSRAEWCRIMSHAGPRRTTKWHGVAAHFDERPRSDLAQAVDFTVCAIQVPPLITSSGTVIGTVLYQMWLHEEPNVGGAAPPPKTLCGMRTGTAGKEGCGCQDQDPTTGRPVVGSHHPCSGKSYPCCTVAGWLTLVRRRSSHDIFILEWKSLQQARHSQQSSTALGRSPGHQTPLRSAPCAQAPAKMDAVGL